MMLSGWGRFPVADCSVASYRGQRGLEAIWPDNGTLIARGNGRSYGDAALNPELTLSLLSHNRMIEFDPMEGRLTCEAGVLLRDVLDVFVPHGWFPPVTPGTKFVTIGGMVAADVHGKNHHLAGTFGRYVDSLTLLRADGSVATCSDDQHKELFRATIGGMGLTGVILTVTWRLVPIETAYIRQETLEARDLDRIMDQFAESSDWTYTVAWIDCLATGANHGRAVLFRGEHATLADLTEKARASPLTTPKRQAWRVPVVSPGVLLNRSTARCFNALYYRRASSTRDVSIIDYDTFFYPLDSLLEWNRIYGRKGFTQYQCVLPKSASPAGLSALLRAISRSGQGSFLSVLKLLGPQQGPLSFPMEGYTLALDFPMRAGTLHLLDQLDEIVAAHGGRVYLAKDARMSPKSMREGYPELPEFERLRTDLGAKGRFESLLSRRLML